MPNAYTTRGLRGANAVDAQPQRLEGVNGQRWACGRNVKGETNEPGRYQVVEVWTLKHRVNGKAVTVETGCTREQAEDWIKL